MLDATYQRVREVADEQKAAAVLDRAKREWHPPGNTLKQP
jgi:hypothetical protein